MTEKVRWRISPDAIQAESWLDILPAVGEDPRALGYDGSQPPCSLGAKRPRFDRTSRRVAVPTVTHILPKRILSYLSANIHRTRLVAPHDSQTHRPRSTRFPSRFRPQHEHVLLAFLFNEDAVFLGFGLESRGEAVELPNRGACYSRAYPTSPLEYRSPDATDLAVDTLLDFSTVTSGRVSSSVRMNSERWVFKLSPLLRRSLSCLES